MNLSQQVRTVALWLAAFITLGLIAVIAAAQQSPKPVSDESNPKTTKQNPSESSAPNPTRTENKVAQPSTTAQELHSEPTDLSGTYAGTFRCDEVGLTGETTLTINGNQFSTADGKSGRIVAARTQDYTAVALHMEAAPGSAPIVVSFRGRKNGNMLSLLPVAGAIQQCSFMPTRNVATRSRTVTEPRRETNGAEGVPVSNPAVVGPSPEDTEPVNRKAKKKKPRKPSAMSHAVSVNLAIASQNLVQDPQQPSPSPSPIPSPSPSPSPGPSPDPSPGPSPSPAPMPTPVPNPSPSPSPSPLPSPSPSPQPKHP